MIALTFAAGWIVGASCLAFALGAAIRMADMAELDCTCDEDEDEPVYVPQEWLA